MIRYQRSFSLALLHNDCRGNQTCCYASLVNDCFLTNPFVYVCTPVNCELLSCEWSTVKMHNISIGITIIHLKSFNRRRHDIFYSQFHIIFLKCSGVITLFGISFFFNSLLRIDSFSLVLYPTQSNLFIHEIRNDNISKPCNENVWTYP